MHVGNKAIHSKVPHRASCTKLEQVLLRLVFATPYYLVGRVELFASC